MTRQEYEEFGQIRQGLYAEHPEYYDTGPKHFYKVIYPSGDTGSTHASETEIPYLERYGYRLEKMSNKEGMQIFRGVSAELNREPDVWENRAPVHNPDDDIVYVDSEGRIHVVRGD